MECFQQHMVPSVIPVETGITTVVHSATPFREIATMVPSVTPAEAGVTTSVFRMIVLLTFLVFLGNIAVTPAEAGVTAASIDGEVLSIQSYFECLLGRKFSNVAHLQRVSDLSEREIYRLGWLVSSVRPLSSWRFQTGEIINIRKFNDRYEVTFRLPAVKKEYLRSGFAECLYYDEARTARREWVEETRVLPVKSGKFERTLFDGLEGAVIGDLEKSLTEYRKHGKKVDLMELLVEEALIDTRTLDSKEKGIVERFKNGK